MAGVVTLDAPQAREYMAELIEVLRDSVDNGGSVGFLPPLDTDEAQHFWEGMIAEVAEGSRILIVAQDDARRVIGTVSLGLVMKPNGKHRAEVQKLLVHTNARRHGIGRALMDAAEMAARHAKRTMLYLDTREGDPASALYRSMGYVQSGIIPRYVTDTNGAYQTTVVFYKLLD